MKMEHLVFLDSVYFLPCALRKQPEAFVLQATKSWYPNYLSTEEHLYFVGSVPDILYYGVDEMSAWEREEFLVWYGSHKPELFDNRHVLEVYCQDDFTVLRQFFRAFRREFMQIGIIEVFLESLTISSACNKELRRRFLKSHSIGLIPTEGYTCNNKYSKKAIMRLIHME